MVSGLNLRRAKQGFDKRLARRYIYATAMKSLPTDPKQSMQRVRVGLTGLASVLLLIGVASAIFSSANKERPVVADGASKPEVVANMTDGVLDNEMAATKDEPIAEPPERARAAFGDAQRDLWILDVGETRTLDGG